VMSDSADKLSLPYDMKAVSSGVIEGRV